MASFQNEKKKQLFPRDVGMLGVPARALIILFFSNFYPKPFFLSAAPPCLSRLAVDAVVNSLLERKGHGQERSLNQVKAVRCARKISKFVSMFMIYQKDLC